MFIEYITRREKSKTVERRLRLWVIWIDNRVNVSFYMGLKLQFGGSYI